MTSDDEIFLLFMNLHVVLRNSTPAEFAYIWQSNSLFQAFRWWGAVRSKKEREKIKAREGER